MEEIGIPLLFLLGVFKLFADGKEDAQVVQF